MSATADLNQAQEGERPAKAEAWRVDIHAARKPLAVCAVCVVALSACGAGRPQVSRVNGTAQMKITSEANGRITEEGTLKGAFHARLAVYINVVSGEITHFTMTGTGGTLAGSAPQHASHFIPNGEQFENGGFIEKGTGTFARVRRSKIKFVSVAERSGAITNTASGRVAYR